MITQEQLKNVAVEVLKAYGESKLNAALAADCLVKADMRGIFTHGTYLLVTMYDRIQAGMLNIPTRVKLIKEDKATTMIDGGNGLGQIAARRAMEISMDKAQKYGIAVTSLRNTNNISFLSYYTDLASQKGMIGITASNAAPSVAPWGSSEAFIGSSPFSVSIPAKKENPIILDMSSGVVARGKIRRALRNKEQIPLGWALDQNGNPTTDPEAALQGTLLPIAGPKGSALAMIVDIISGMLAGSKYGPDVKTFHKLEGPTGVGVICMAIDINHFMDLSNFYAKVDDYIHSIKGLSKVKGNSEIYLPGEIELLNEQKAAKEGIILDSSTLEKLNDLLIILGIQLRL